MACRCGFYRYQANCEIKFRVWVTLVTSVQVSVYRGTPFLRSSTLSPPIDAYPRLACKAYSVTINS